MKERKRKYPDLPPISDPNYQKLYRQKNAERLKEHGKNYYKRKVEENPNYYADTYDAEKSALYRKVRRKETLEYFWKRRGIIDLTYERFCEDLEKQNNKCKICEEVLTLPQSDHDHKTGLYRGILCAGCNTGLGVYEKMNEKFKIYLEEHNKSKNFSRIEI